MDRPLKPLSDLGLAPYDIVRFKEGSRWLHGAPRAVNFDGSLFIVPLSPEQTKTFSGRQVTGGRSIALDRVERQTVGRGKALVWRPLVTS